MQPRFIAVAALLVLFPTSALAQSAPTKGYALDRFEPAERGGDWFGAESVTQSPAVPVAIGATLDYAHQPLVMRDGDGDEVVDLVRHQMFLHLGAGFTLAENLRLGLNVPIALVNKGEDGTLGGNTYSLNEGAAFGDLRIGGNYRLFGGDRGKVRGALGLTLHLPTGSPSAFTGDDGLRATPAFDLGGDIKSFAYAAGLGWKLHGRGSNFAGEAYGSDLETKLAAGLWVAKRRVLLGPELYLSTPMSDGGDGFFGKRTTPAELIFGGHALLGKAWYAGLGLGPGITRGMGSPELRLLASLEWRAPGRDEDGDRDGDGILDSQDACPRKAGKPSSDPELNGCPPKDRDQDGILDEDDACPDEAGPENEDPKLHGCPLPGDRDNDGIKDSEDACPDEAGPENEDPELNGCPVGDSDGDGIKDADDACPKEPGVESDDPAKHGCPLAKVEKGQIVILEQVQFATGSAEILPASDGILQAVKKILTEHPEITKVSIEGHTDNRGGAALNTNLSRARAASVQRWLVANGIDAGRLSSAGYGPDRPLADNDSDAGRQKNRRVEFHIVDTDKGEGSASK